MLWTNCEAATEIARQLRLRNIAGVIVVDFIDMDARRDQLQVLEQFNKSLRSDKARPQIAQLSELGLVELTRKRQGQNIYELFGQTCPTCGGMGHLVHLPGELDLDLPEVEARGPAETRSIPSREPRESREQPRETWERTGDEFEADASSDLQELDLTNHPNYQERGRGGDRRRRRSTRMKVSEPALKGVVAPKLEAETEEEPVALEEPTSSTPVRVAKEPRADKPERSRSGRREKQAAEPPQVISVEMTPDQQDVYALMGISPLVLCAETIKDPKSTIISIAAPGQAPRLLSERPSEDSEAELEILAPAARADADLEEPAPEQAEPKELPREVRQLSIAPPIRRSDLDNAAAALSELLPEAASPLFEAKSPKPLKPEAAEPEVAELDSEAEASDSAADAGDEAGDASSEASEAGSEASDVRRRRRRRSSTAP